MDRSVREIVQPVSTEQVRGAYEQVVDDGNEVSTRAIRDVLGDLETMGLVEIRTESRGRDGRVKQIETAFEPVWAQESFEEELVADTG